MNKSTFFIKYDNLQQYTIPPDTKEHHRHRHCTYTQCLVRGVTRNNKFIYLISTIGEKYNCESLNIMSLWHAIFE